VVGQQVSARKRNHRAQPMAPCANTMEAA
jgi:hypothetical protein